MSEAAAGEQARSERLRSLGSAMLHEASGRIGALGPQIRPAWCGARLAGRCRTVLSATGDNLAVHHAVERVAVGEVICLAAPGGHSFGVWGEVITRSAVQRGAAGLVMSCAVRDIDAIEALAFPVFAPGHSIQGTVKRDAGRHGIPIRIGQALIRHGDWIVGDSDGCVVITAQRVDELIAIAEQKVETEQHVMTAISSGASSRTALALP